MVLVGIPANHHTRLSTHSRAWSIVHLLNCTCTTYRYGLFRTHITSLCGCNPRLILPLASVFVRCRHRLRGWIKGFLCAQLPYKSDACVTHTRKEDASLAYRQRGNGQTRRVEYKALARDAPWRSCTSRWILRRVNGRSHKQGGRPPKLVHLSTRTKSVLLHLSLRFPSFFFSSSPPLLFFVVVQRFASFQRVCVVPP